MGGGVGIEKETWVEELELRRRQWVEELELRRRRRWRSLN